MFPMGAVLCGHPISGEAIDGIGNLFSIPNVGYARLKFNYLDTHGNCTNAVRRTYTLRRSSAFEVSLCGFFSRSHLL
jgi:hypothetical protein